MKIVSVVGARPQFIKYAILSKELRKEHYDILIHTGQHYDYTMSRVFFEELGIPAPDYNLCVGSGTHANQTGDMLKGIEGILLTMKPDMVMVYGDTNSTIAGALCASKLHIKVAHVEAGLRSFDRSMPEEINRILTDHCSNYLFCPTQTAIDNLIREGITDGAYLTGDVMVDALEFNKKIAEKSEILNTLGLTSKQYIVITIHRAANTDIQERLENIIQALIKLSERGETIVFPIHPRTENLLGSSGLYNKLISTVRIIEPLGYYDFLKLLDHSKKILTDSGGIQKEAYILKVPCVTLRENTEWVETISDGWNILAGSDKNKIVDLAQNFNPTHSQSSIFGNGACKEITRIMATYLFQ